MSKECTIPLSAAFYKELASIAWSGLSDTEKADIYRFLVFRFMDSGTEIFDGLTKARVGKLFKEVVDQGDLDGQIKEQLSNTIVSEILERELASELSDVRYGFAEFLDKCWEVWSKEHCYEEQIDQEMRKYLDSKGFTDRIHQKLEHSLSSTKIMRSLERVLEQMENG